MGDNLVAQVLGHGRAAMTIDVEPVGGHANGHHVSAQLPENGRRHLVGGAMGAIDDDLESLERAALGEGALCELDIAALSVFQAHRAAQRRRLGQGFRPAVLHQRFNIGLGRVRQLEAVRAEQFDPIVLEGIVRGRDHHAEVGAQRAGEHRHRRGRQRADQHHIHAHGGENRRSAPAPAYSRDSRVSLPITTRWRCSPRVK